jgi:hypothetical protein
MAENRINDQHPTADAVLRAAIQRLQTLAVEGIRLGFVTGGNGAGGRTCEGAILGDRVAAVFAYTNTTVPVQTQNFVSTVLVAGTVNQTATNLSGAPLVALLINPDSP